MRIFIAFRKWFEEIRSLEQNERYHIMAAMEITNGNKKIVGKN